MNCTVPRTDSSTQVRGQLLNKPGTGRDRREPRGPHSAGHVWEPRGGCWLSIQLSQQSLAGKVGKRLSSWVLFLTFVVGVSCRLALAAGMPCVCTSLPHMHSKRGAHMPWASPRLGPRIRWC